MRKPLKKTFIFLLLGSVLLLAKGCFSGHRAIPIEPPSQALDNCIQAAKNNVFFDSTISEKIPNEWWELFHDDQLTFLIQTALEHNPTLHQAQVKVLLAAATAQRVRSSLYPNILFGADISRQKLSETGIIPFNNNTSGTSAAAASNETGAQPTIFGLPPGAGLVTPVTAGKNLIPVYFTQYETELTLTYEFDIWGKNRNRWCAAIGEMKASMADQAFIQLQLAVAIAKLYYKLQIHYKRLELARMWEDNRQENYKFNKQKLVNHIGNAQQLYAADFELSQAKQNVLEIEKTIAVSQYELQAYLATDFQDDINSVELKETNLPKIPFPDQLPLHLLSNRPDITAQIWLIESASNQIKAAKAEFYPDFNLFALIGLQTIHLSKLFYGKSAYFNVDPAVTLPLFDGGRLLANLSQTENEYDEAIYTYNQLILQAAQEVLSEIAILSSLQKEMAEYKKKTSDQQKIIDLTALRVIHNLDSRLNYLANQEQWIKARDQELLNVQAFLESILNLIKALGGGYESCIDGEI